MTMFQRIIRVLLLTGGIAGFTPCVIAATYEDIQRLDAAYPPGSVVVCRSALPGDGKGKPPTTQEIRGTVMARQPHHAEYAVSIAWITKGLSSAGLTLTFRMTQRSDETGQYSRIDRDSMAVAMPGVGSAGEAAVLKGFKDRFADKENFTPYRQIAITDFPAYTTRSPDEAPAYCHRETPDHD